MTDKETKQKSTANAIIWAAMMLATALVVKDGNNSSAMIAILIAGWLASAQLLVGKNALKSECAMWRRIMGRGKAAD